jgi:superfamily I DNA/RNA helicase
MAAVNCCYEWSLRRRRGPRKINKLGVVGVSDLISHIRFDFSNINAVVSRFEGGLQEATHVAGAIAELIAQGRSPADIAVLSRTLRALDTMRGAIERAGVACSGLSVPREARAERGLRFQSGPQGGGLRLLYVGMTRATHRLALSAMGNSGIVDHVEQFLEKVKRAYH